VETIYLIPQTFCCGHFALKMQARFVAKSTSDDSQARVTASTWPLTESPRDAVSALHLAVVRGGQSMAEALLTLAPK